MRVLVNTQDNLEFLVDLPAARFSWKGGEKAYIYLNPEEFVFLEKKNNKN